MIQGNKFHVGSILASQLARQYGTPLYVYDAAVIRERCRELQECITYRPLSIKYAVKANTNVEILKVLKSEGIHADAVSNGEIAACLKAGFSPDEIMFTCNNPTDEELQYAIERGILVNVDSLSALRRYGKLNPNSKVCVRINPDVGAGHHDHCITGGPESKFGIYFTEVEKIKEVAKEHNLTIAGVHEHIGTGIMETDKFILAMRVLLKVAREFPDLEFIDFGGGIGIPYREGQPRLPLKEFGAQVSELFAAFCKDYGRELALAIEPGRYLVAESGALLCQVNTVKPSAAHTFVGVNTGFNHLIRPTMYGSYHKIVKVDEVESSQKEKVAICGNICESGDVFTRDEHGIVDRELPALSEGDVLALLDAGAYGYSMASTYNTRPRPAEVLVSGTTSRIIREADKVEDLL